MIHIRKGIKKILKSGFYRVRIRIPGPESGKFETNFFLKCIVANIFPETKFALKRFLLQAAFINQAPSLGLNYAYLMVLDGSTFSSKILRGVDWSFLFLNFRCICLLSIFRVSETAQWTRSKSCGFQHPKIDGKNVKSNSCLLSKKWL